MEPEAEAASVGSKQSPGSIPEGGPIPSGEARTSIIVDPDSQTPVHHDSLSNRTGCLRERTADERPVEPTAWQPDSSQQAAKADTTNQDLEIAEIVVQAKQGKPTLRTAYFFAGKSRNGSIGEELKTLCRGRDFGVCHKYARMEWHTICTYVSADTYDILLCPCTFMYI